MKSKGMENAGISSLAVIVAAGFLAMVMALFFALNAGEKDTIKIGAIISMSGPASHRFDIRDGLQLAAEEINHWGGINGRRIELIIADSKTDPEESKKAFNRIEAEHQPLLYISNTSVISMVLAPLAEQNRVVLVGVVVVTRDLTRDREWVFKYYTSSEQQATPILYLLRQLRVRKLGILYQNDDFGTDVFYVLKEKFEKTGGAVISEPFDLKHPDFKTGTGQLMDKEAVYAVGYSGNTVKAIRQLRENNFQGIILGSSGISGLSGTVPELNGVYVAAPVIYNPQYPFAREAKERYEARYGKPFTHQAANGYDFIRLLSGLLEDKKISRENLKRLLEEGFMYPGIFGEIVVEPEDHDIHFPLHPARINEKDIEFIR